RYLDGPATIHMGHERARAMEEGDLVLLEKIQDAVVVLLDDGALASDQGVQLELDALDLNAVLGEVVVGLFEMLGRLQQSLGRDAAHIGASAARRRFSVGSGPCVYAGNGHAQLGCADSGNVAAGACTDNDDVELFSHVLSRSG